MAKKIYLSPSDQYANKYAAGNTTEEKQCERIADACAAALKRCGFEVKNNKTSSMTARIAESNKWGADLHVPIHTNAYNKKVAGTRLFCWDMNGAGYKACKAIFDKLAPLTPGTSENITDRQDLAELRDTTAVCTYIEVDFHDVASVAEWIIKNVEAIGEAIAKGICAYYGVKFVEPEKQPAQLETGSTLYTVCLGFETSKKDEAVAQLEKAVAAGFKNATLVSTTKAALKA